MTKPQSDSGANDVRADIAKKREEAMVNYMQKSAEVVVNKYVQDTINDQVKKGIEPKYVAGGEIEKDGSLRQWDLKDYNLLHFLYTNAPGAPHCINKIAASVYSSGFDYRPKFVGKKMDKGEIRAISEFIDTVDLETVGETALRNHMGYGDDYMAIAYKRRNGSNSRETYINGKKVSITSVSDCWNLMPEYTEVWVDKNLLQKAGRYKAAQYRYSLRTQNANSEVIWYDPEDVIHWKRPSVTDPVYGSAVLQDGSTEINLGLRVLNHNLRFFSNSGKPPLMIHLDKDINREKAEEFARYYKAHYEGANNAWKTFIGYGGTRVDELTLPDSTAFKDMLDYVLRQVCALFGVPLSVIGITDNSNRSNSETSLKDYIRNTVNNYKRKQSNIFNVQLFQKRMDIKTIDVVLPPAPEVSTKQLVEEATKGIRESLYSINEGRELRGLEKINESWADELLFGTARSIYKLDEVLDDGEKSPAGQSGGDSGGTSDRADDDNLEGGEKEEVEGDDHETMNESRTGR